MQKPVLTPSEILDRERQVSEATSEMVSILSEVESIRKSVESIMRKLDLMDRGVMNTTFARGSSFKSVLQFRPVKASILTVHSILRKLVLMTPRVRSASSNLSDSVSNPSIPS